jgi:hypothetical protein
MDWSNFQVGKWWPLLLGIAGMLVLFMVWYRSKGELFPDIRLLSDTAPAVGTLDRLPLILGGVIVILLMISMMDITTTRSTVVNKTARDFMVVVDTSRSMRENTSILRENVPTTFPRGAGLYSGQVDDPSTIPELARYELARESLLHFMGSLNQNEDRIQLTYFNSQVYLMSGFTTNFNFLKQQLEAMDPYVTYGTNIRWALEQGLNMIDRYPSRNRQAVILLTDAEAKNTDDLKEQLYRLGQLDLSFYLLWITSDSTGEVSQQALEFLRSTRAIGTAFTIEDMDEGNLDKALDAIGKLESYAYEEFQHEQIDLSEYVFVLARWLMLLWILLLATIYHPARLVTFSGRS